MHKLVLWSVVVTLFIIVPVLQINAQNRFILDREIKRGTWKGQEIKYVAGQVLVKLKPGLSSNELRPFLMQQGAKIAEDFDCLRWGLIEFPEDVNIFEKMKIFKKNSFIETVEPNGIGCSASNIPNDPLFEEQWALRNSGPFQRSYPYNKGKVDADIDAPEAWDIETGNSNVVIAILDHGIALDESDQPCHPDLDDPNKIVLGDDYTNDGNSVKDEKGHGTHVAGIAAAETNNATGIAGVCWGSKILVIQVFTKHRNDTDETTCKTLENGIRSAVDYKKANPTKKVVINLSGGALADSSEVLEDAVQYADANNCLLVAAVGNVTGSNIHSPALLASYGTRPGHHAGYNNVIAVGATTVYDKWTGSSKYKVPGDHLTGIGVTVVAPGGEPSPNNPNDKLKILSTFPYYIGGCNYACKDGTSMAAPYVAGVAALILSKYPDLDDWEVRQIIEQSAEDVNYEDGGEWEGVDKRLGYGRINAFRALAYAIAYVNQLIVPDNYTDIQDAIDAASSGQFVFVKAGTYTASVQMKNGVSLIGHGYYDTEIQAGVMCPAVSFVSVSDAKLVGFKLKGYPGAGYAAVEVKNCYDCDDILIEDNYIYDSWAGIYCYESDSLPEIKNNVINGNDFGIYAYSHSDPEAYEGYNDLSGNYFGVYCFTGSEPKLGYSTDFHNGNNNINNTIFDVYASSTCQTIYAIYNYWQNGAAPKLHHGHSSHTIEWQPPLDHNPLLNKGCGDPIAHNLQGLKLFYEGKYEAAIAEFKYVIDNYPQHEEARFALDNLVMTYRKLKKAAEVLPYLTSLAQSYSQSLLGGNASEFIIPFELKQGDNDGAISRINTLRNQFKNTEFSRNLLFKSGMLYKYHIRDKQKATEVFRQIVEIYAEEEIACLAEMELNTMDLPFQENQRAGGSQAESLVLSQNYPNPANPTTSISFSLPEATHIRLEIYNLLGRRVKTLVKGTKPAGSHSAVWDGCDESGKVVSSGIYLYHLKCHLPNSRPGGSADFVRVKKMLLLR